MNSTRKQLIEFIENCTIPQENIDKALKATKVIPDGKSWLFFLDLLLVWLGGLALAFAVMFFIAYNWHDIGHFLKFAIVEVFMVLAIVLYFRLDEHKTSGKVALLVASLALGVLLALYNQIYQTGADTW